MTRELLISCLPYLFAACGGLAALRALVWLSGARISLAHARQLPSDERGAVQSLSFVLTLPVFILIMMFIVQLSQIVIAKVVVEYAAFSAARSAIVWIPASLGPAGERENQISSLAYIDEMRDENGVLFQRFEVLPGSQKYAKVHLAAAMAVLPLAPTRRMAVAGTHPGNAALPSLRKAYRGVSPASMGNPRIPTRLANKLAYALENTGIRIEIRHKDDDPPLVQHGILPYVDEYAPGEIAWQDQVIVTVAHDFALLPGPARLMASPAASGGPTTGSTFRASPAGSPGSLATSPQTYGGGLSSTAEPSRQIAGGGQVFVKRITATVRLNNEGEKPVLPYIQRLTGVPAPDFGPADLDGYFYGSGGGTSPGETRESTFRPLDWDEEAWFDRARSTD